MIDRVLAGDEFESAYEKKLANFSIEVLSGNLGDVSQLLIVGAEEDHSGKHSVSNSA